MKKIISTTICLIYGLTLVSQNSIPTTTVNGTLKITDSLNVNKRIIAKGEIISKDTLRAEKDIIVDGNITIGGKLKVDADAKFKNDVKLTKGFTFDGTNGITIATTSNNSKTLFYGNTTGSKALSAPCAATPYSPLNNAFGGGVQIYDPLNPTTSGLLNLQTWTGGSSIDASIGGQTGNGGLLLNYFCGNNTYINTGINGGKVSMGKIVEIGMPIQDLNTTLNILAPYSTSGKILKIKNNNINFPYDLFNILPDGNVNINGYERGLNITTNSGSVGNCTNLYNLRLEAIGSNCTDLIQGYMNFGSSEKVFQVKHNGETHIGEKDQMPRTQYATNAKLVVGGMIVAQHVRVTMNNWADNVFAKDYKLLSIKDVEKYYNENKHLPEIPSEKEVLVDGIDLGEMNKILLKKVEELTLYLVEQQKQIDALKQTVENLKK